MDTQSLKTDAYLIASVVCGAFSLVGVQFSVASVASLIIAIGGALMIVVPAALATWREIHHLNLRSVQAASASLATTPPAIPAPPASTAPVSPSYMTITPVPPTHVAIPNNAADKTTITLVPTVSNLPPPAAAPASPVASDATATSTTVSAT